MIENSRFYVVYNEHFITICSSIDDVFDEMAEGGIVYGYTDNEDIAQGMLKECFHELTANKS